ncbi:ATP-dependent Clp protease proteolytic subunit [Leptolyngbyaceae cyanobacterium UHCC 1019]
MTTKTSSQTFLLIAALFLGILDPLSAEIAFGKDFTRSQPKRNQTEVPKTGQSNGDRKNSSNVGEWLSGARIIFITGEINAEMAESVIAQLLYLDSQAPEKDIYLYINSGGGSISAGLAMYDTMRSLRSNVVTVSLGEASSMASLLLAGGTKGKRLALTHSRMMIHQPLGGTWGQASEIAIEAKEILYLKSLLNRLLAESTGQSLKKIEEDTDRNLYLSAEQAKAYGLVDKVVNKLPSASQP